MAKYSISLRNINTQELFKKWTNLKTYLDDCHSHFSVPNSVDDSIPFFQNCVDLSEEDNELEGTEYWLNGFGEGSIARLEARFLNEFPSRVSLTVETTNNPCDYETVYHNGPGGFQDYEYVPTIVDNSRLILNKIIYQAHKYARLKERCKEE